MVPSVMLSPKARKRVADNIGAGGGGGGGMGSGPTTGPGDLGLGTIGDRMHAVPATARTTAAVSSLTIGMLREGSADMPGVGASLFQPRDGLFSELRWFFDAAGEFLAHRPTIARFSSVVHADRGPE